MMTSTSKSAPKNILLLAANPKGTQQLRLDEEVRKIKKTLAASKCRDDFEITQGEAITTDDLRGYLLNHQPYIVHFSGHGDKEGIYLEDESGHSHLVPVHALANFFGIFKNTIQCVVLNACHSQQQAEAITENIPYVVGTIQAIQDQDAINFSKGFYQALFSGCNIQIAFDNGYNNAEMHHGENNNGRSFVVDYAEVTGKSPPIILLGSGKIAQPHPANSSTNNKRPYSPEPPTKAKPQAAKKIHSINYTLHQHQALAHTENTLGISRVVSSQELENDDFGEPPIQAMSDFLLGNSDAWQQMNRLLGSNNPKRLRIMTDDAQLAMLPWQRLQHPSENKPLIESGWSVEVSPIISNTEHLCFSEQKAISNPLIVMPLEAGKDIGTSVNRNIIQEYMHEYLGIVGSISFTTTAYGMQQALNIDPPDFIYIYAPINTNQIQLDIDPTNPLFEHQNLHLETLAKWLEETSHRPSLVLHLAGKEPIEYPKQLVQQCNLLWMQHRSRKPEQMINSFLTLLESITSEGKGDITQLISKQSLKCSPDCSPNIWIKNNTPSIVSSNTSGLSIGQLRATLLRVALGRKHLKNMLFGEINPGENFGTKTCICLAINGDETACPYIFPAQLRQRLQWEDKRNSFNVTNFDIYLDMTEGTDPRRMMEDIQYANDNYILQGKDDIADMLEARHKIRNQETVIMFNWYLKLRDVDEKQLSNWIKAMLRVIQTEFIAATPDNAVMLCTFCFQTENEDLAGEAQEIVDMEIAQGETRNIKAIEIGTALGRIRPIELTQFFGKRERWHNDLNLTQADIDPRAFTKWIHNKTKGRFEETVIALWQQYQHDYQEYLSHE